MCGIYTKKMVSHKKKNKKGMNGNLPNKITLKHTEQDFPSHRQDPINLT